MLNSDPEIRRLLCNERVEQLARDARRPARNRRRRRRLMQIALSKLALSPANRARRPSLGS